MCTAPHPIGVAAYGVFLETNMGDPHLHPGTTEIEVKALRGVLRMLNAPNSAWAAPTSGGSDANLTGLRIATKRSGKREVIVPETAHFSFNKVADYLGLKLVRAQVGTDFTVDTTALRKLVSPDTAAIVGIAGTTELGTVDDVPELAKISSEAGVHLHVDASFGGFVIPFLPREVKVPAFDFTNGGVSTIAVDGHKMGMAPIPSGFLAARDGADIDLIGTETPYVSTKRQPTIRGTRPGAASAATYAVMEHLGVDGYRKVVKTCIADSRFLASELEAMGVALTTRPVLNIVTFRVKRPIVVRDALMKKGWLLTPAHLTGGLRVTVMPHVTRSALKRFLLVLRRVLKTYGEI
jgi:tyrosine decarboxylase/aspartate 1-decarboxylase